MSPELQAILDRAKSVHDAIRLLKETRKEIHADKATSYGWDRMYNAGAYLENEAKANETAVAAYFSPEVAA